MSILKVARMGHPVLREPARPIEPDEVRNVRIQKLIDDMLETMREYRGVGLAAPQVHERLRLFVAILDEDDDEKGDAAAEDSEPVAIINPELTVIDAQLVEDWEGCLSVPDIRGRVPRVREVVLRALDRDANRVEIRASDYLARVVQHETDHLDGVLFFDRMRDLGSLTFAEEYGKYWKTD